MAKGYSNVFGIYHGNVLEREENTLFKAIMSYCKKNKKEYDRDIYAEFADERVLICTYKKDGTIEFTVNALGVFSDYAQRYIW